MHLIRTIVYRLGFRPRPGSIFYSPSQDLLEAMKTVRKQMEDYQDTTWLDRNYGGAPDECTVCYRNGKLVKAVDCQEH